MQKGVIVLGYRAGLAAAVVKRGYTPLCIVHKDKGETGDWPTRKVAELEDAQEIIRAALSFGGDVAGVVTGHDEGVFGAAVLRDALGLPGDRGYARLLCFRDKYLQKHALGDAVPHARCVYLTRQPDFAALAAQLGAPFVVKPSNGAGSKETRFVASQAELDTHYSGGAKRSDVAFVAESALKGEELFVDGVWQDGRVVFHSVGRYRTPMIQWSTGKTMAVEVLSRAEAPRLFERAHELVTRSLRRLGAPDVVFHLECFDDGEDLVFSECAARLGGTLVPEIVKHTYGFDLYEAQLDVALGKPLSQPVPVRIPDTCYAGVYLRACAARPLTRRDFDGRFDLVELDYPDSTAARPGLYGRVGHAVVRGRGDGQLAREVERLITFSEAGRDG
jgi:hypothetical protein